MSQFITSKSSAAEPTSGPWLRGELDRSNAHRYGKSFYSLHRRLRYAKNLVRLIVFSITTVRASTHQLVFAGRMSWILNEVKSLRRADDQLVFTDSSEEDLVGLQPVRACVSLFMRDLGCPFLRRCLAEQWSWRLPPSVPEVLGESEALFDPLDVNDMSSKLWSALCDETFRERMRDHALRQSKQF